MLFSQIRERTRARIEIFIYIYKFAKLFREKYLTNEDLLLILQIKKKLDFWGVFRWLVMKIVVMRYRFE